MGADWIVPDWKAPAGIGAAVSTRRGPGVSESPYDRLNLGLRSGDDVAAVEVNRRSLTEALALPAPPRWLRQVHGIAVADACAAGDDEPVADASVARGPGQVLAILTADCLPVLFVSADGQTIGAAHAGWRGLAAGVLENTVTAMAADGIQAWLGPAIGASSYEVGEEVRAAFVDGDDGAAQAFASTRPGHWHCDLYALARRRLAQVGVAQVSGGGFDTLTDERLYSYRRDGANSGRFASLIWTGA
ncbi:multi-copper polyphenol oxidoreductase [Luteibacter rhizovicinus DSM 16549]|uniref:Purine nucleoside phosphorylase n=1 Tax=Luteibacter rhizovicinus DSM 16549 TaxID=1440763 RepID=A0A0G9H8F5_9GAMM|nr:peptidoglycan editing factor PgeF [Luteibacter rhizovicinus]APG03041.1 multi-copper polyphenol oxidoreductase [Luteibacter rhizovicinus DSM 16549]KLD65529.1 laccase [Luteibacter rhizovicinus DSM 16549]KLD78496.1 laccase [Xanthomonas hyacinthi DSM 19077]